MSQLRLATYQMLQGHIWPAAVTLDSPGLVFSWSMSTDGLIAPSGRRRKEIMRNVGSFGEIKRQFVKRKVLTRSSGKCNFTSELFIYTGQTLLHSRVDFVVMGGGGGWNPTDLMLVIS